MVMKRTMAAVIMTALITFMVTENFALSHVTVRQQDTGYMVSMFGVETLVK